MRYGTHTTSVASRGELGGSLKARVSVTGELLPQLLSCSLLTCRSFPYTDTLKILRKWGPGCHFLGSGGIEDIPALEATLQANANEPDKILALFCEFPSNPLLRSPDLSKIRELADQYGFAVVIDETIGNFINVEVVQYADIVVSSLTKIFSGDANVMGGR